MSEIKETVTQDELAEAMMRRHWSDPDERAKLLFDDIKKHREPEWQEGDVVRDAIGFKWVYHNMSWDKVWTPLGAIYTNYESSRPARPLTRLVEEKREGS